jgi:ATP-dependent Clp protease ATP-binding subunit ClpA
MRRNKEAGEIGPMPDVYKIYMNEYVEPHSIAKLLGSPPGYVGYGDTSLLEKISQHPGCKVIFSELDHADPRIIEAIFDKDRETGLHSIKPEITLGDGRKIHFSGITVIVAEEEARKTAAEQEARRQELLADAANFRKGLSKPIKALKPFNLQPR